MEEINHVYVENLLSGILKDFAFITKMKLILIEEISVNKKRFEKAKYEHFINELNNNDKKAEVLDVFYENNAIVLIDDEKKPGFYLNLSPLIIYIVKEETTGYLKKTTKGIGSFDKITKGGKLEFSIINKSTVIAIDDENISLFNKLKMDLLSK